MELEARSGAADAAHLRELVPSLCRIMHRFRGGHGRGSGDGVAGGPGGGFDGEFLDPSAAARSELRRDWEAGVECAGVFYRDVCGREEVNPGVKFRRRGRRVPVVLSRREVRAVLDELPGSYRVAAGLMYGSGLRLKELLGLRVKDLDFDRRQLVVRGGKGDDDRITILPASSREPLREQLQRAIRRHRDDRTAGLPGVYMPKGLERKFPRAPTSWEWFWIFPLRGSEEIPKPGPCGDTTCTKRCSRTMSGRPPAVRGLRSGSPPTRFATRLPRTCSSEVRIYGLSRSCSATRT